MQTLLVTAKGSRREAERASDIVLIGTSRLEKGNYGVGFRGAISGGVMSKDDAMDQNHSLIAFGLNPNLRVH